MWIRSQNKRILSNVDEVLVTFVDENKLSDCFLYIFQKFFGALPTETLDGYYKKPID